MAQENMKQILTRARAGKYAVGAFNILDFNSMKAAVNAASELNSSIIIQTSTKTVEYWGFKTIISWYNQLASDVTIPVCIHLDHCKDINFIRKCLDHGWTSVMIDASSLPFDANIELSQKVVDLAKPFNASVEAELGEIGGVEDDLVVTDEDAHLAKPERAAEFLLRVGIDCFAPAIGTAHGVYKGEPKIAFSNLEIIGKNNATPLALHGGTGLSDEVFHKCIALGCAKINISTKLKYVFIDSFNTSFQSHPKEYNPLIILEAQYIELKKAVSEYLVLFGSAGKA
jgi:ketose-bisphosphate aldolase